MICQKCQSRYRTQNVVAYAECVIRNRVCSNPACRHRLRTVENIIAQRDGKTREKPCKTG